jgi:hypothetical protein
MNPSVFGMLKLTCISGKKAIRPVLRKTRRKYDMSVDSAISYATSVASDHIRACQLVKLAETLNAAELTKALTCLSLLGMTPADRCRVVVQDGMPDTGYAEFA